MTQQHPIEAVEEEDHLFGQAHTRTIDRILKRTQEKAAECSRKEVEPAFRQDPFHNVGNTTRARFQSALNCAVQSHYRQYGGPSIRMTAPDSGGRPFCFKHIAVTPLTLRLKPGETSPGPYRGNRKNSRQGRSRDKRHTSSGAAHMLYLEREHALETAEIEQETAAAKPRYDGAHEAEFGHERDARASIVQSYIEDQQKISANIGSPEGGPVPPVTAFSFGTIGETRKERADFWDLVEQHPERGNAVLQHRFILELPKEATPQQRLTIMRGYCAWFEERRIPYWAVLHAPTANNDPRNFHAHLVTLARPAWKILHPEGGEDGKTLTDGYPKPLVATWNFAAITKVKDKFRVTRSRYLHRQNTHDEFTKRSMLKEQRARFAECVNRVMTEGPHPIKYDPRSYKDMGIHLEPIKSVSRLVASKIRKGQRVVLDAKLAKRMIDAEITRATRERDPDVQALAKVEERLKAIISDVQRTGRTDKRLPPLLRTGTLQRVNGGALKLGKAVLTAHKQRLTTKITDRIEETVLERMLAATEPEGISKRHRALKAKIAAAKPAFKKKLESEITDLPSVAEAALLHASILEELDLHRHNAARRRRAHTNNITTRMRTWKAASSSMIFQAARAQLEQLTAFVVRVTDPNDPNGSQQRAVEHIVQVFKEITATRDFGRLAREFPPQSVDADPQPYEGGPVPNNTYPIVAQAGSAASTPAQAPEAAHEKAIGSLFAPGEEVQPRSPASSPKQMPEPPPELPPSPAHPGQEEELSTRRRRRQGAVSTDADRLVAHGDPAASTPAGAPEAALERAIGLMSAPGDEAQSRKPPSSPERIPELPPEGLPPRVDPDPEQEPLKRQRRRQAILAQKRRGADFGR